MVIKCKDSALILILALLKDFHLKNVNLVLPGKIVMWNSLGSVPNATSKVCNSYGLFMQ